VDVEGSFTGRSIAMSPDGTRTYVTGSFGTTYGIVTFAFDSATGAQVWHANHQSPYAQGRLVGTSPDGTRIFSVGLSYGPNNYDEVVIGYDAASGSHLWTSIYDGPEHSEDIPAALGVSPNGGWIYVTGSTENPSYGSFDYATVAIDAATGAQLWSATFDDPGHASDDPSALGMSPDGSRVYVTGTTHDGFPPVDRADFATLAYDASTGALVWKARYDGPAGRADKAFALGVDPGGLAVYVTGSSKGVTTNEDYATLAYDASTGAQLWENRYDGPADNNDVPTSLAVSPSGDAVYVTGTSVGIDTLHDFATMRINV